VDIWRCCLSIDGQRWQSDTSEQWRMEILIAGDQFDGANFCCNRRLRRGRLPFDSRTLADTGLTSTETAELGIDTSGHLFAALVP